MDECLTIYYSPAELNGLETDCRDRPRWAKMLGALRDILPGISWQHGALKVPIRRGDVVVIAGAPRCFSNLAVLVLARLRGARTIWWGHYWSSTSKPWRHALRLAIMQISHSVLFYTDREVEECIRQMGPFAPARLHGLNNGINVDPVEACRRPYDAVERGRRLLFVGRTTEKARIDLLLEALADSRLSNVELEIIGGGNNQDDLKKFTSHLGIEGRIFWHGSITDEAAIAKIANRCTLFVYPGGVGLSLIHSMAYGLPAVVHSNHWHHMPEIAALIPGENGFTFAEGDGSSLAEVLADALSDTAELNRMSQQSLKTVRGSFNTADMAQRFVTAVVELANAAS